MTIAGNFADWSLLFDCIFLAPLIKSGELSTLDLDQPGVWVPVHMDEMLTFEKQEEWSL